MTPQPRLDAPTVPSSNNPYGQTSSQWATTLVMSEKSTVPPAKTAQRSVTLADTEAADIGPISTVRTGGIAARTPHGGEPARHWPFI